MMMLHDLRGAVADLQAHDVAQSLLMRQVERPAVMAVRQQALMDDVDGGLGAEPFAHRGLRRVRLAGVAQAQGVVAELAHRLGHRSRARRAESVTP